MFFILGNEACYSLPIQWMVVGLDNFAFLVLLELKGLDEVKNYSFSSPSSLLVKFFLLLASSLLAVNLTSSYCLQSFQASTAFFSALISSKRKAKNFYPGLALA
jgi:hypothetical protein